MRHQTDDVRIAKLKPLLPPAILMEELAISEHASTLVSSARDAIARAIRGEDDRLLVVAGPCSIHDPEAGLEYASRIAKPAKEFADDLIVVLRVYFEKPRTTVGWKGLINDPHLDGSFEINEGLRRARRFLIGVTELGLPAGTEFLDPISPQFVADLVAWGAIGARTSESQVHRELASGLSMPVGFKNGTTGNLQIAIDGVRASAHPHHFLSVTKQGVAAIVATRGNSDCHVILRGGSDGPNFGADAVEHAAQTLAAAGITSTIMIDCSHANSGKDHERQPETLRDVSAQVAAGNRSISGVMLESFLLDGRQDVVDGDVAGLEFGRSITDQCMSWERTEPLFAELASAVRERRGR